MLMQISPQLNLVGVWARIALASLVSDHLINVVHSFYAVATHSSTEIVWCLGKKCLGA
jgi:hypothetical protein